MKKLIILIYLLVSGFLVFSQEDIILFDTLCQKNMVLVRKTIKTETLDTLEIYPFCLDKYETVRLFKIGYLEKKETDTTFIQSFFPSRIISQGVITKFYYNEKDGYSVVDKPFSSNWKYSELWLSFFLVFVLSLGFNKGFWYNFSLNSVWESRPLFRRKKFFYLFEGISILIVSFFFYLSNSITIEVFVITIEFSLIFVGIVFLVILSNSEKIIKSFTVFSILLIPLFFIALYLLQKISPLGSKIPNEYLLQFYLWTLFSYAISFIIAEIRYYFKRKQEKKEEEFFENASDEELVEYFFNKTQNNFKEIKLKGKYLARLINLSNNSVDVSFPKEKIFYNPGRIISTYATQARVLIKNK
ncbi:hypothetical protein GW932_01410 [archaeon]|nr:hypothetical protein [archaeon]